MAWGTLRTLGKHSLEIRKGGWGVCWRKIRSVTLKILSLASIFFAGPLVFFIVIVRPLVLIRFGTMKSQRIGHFVSDVEAYLCVRDQEQQIRNTLDFIGCPRPVCNTQIMTMWARTLRIVPGGMFWNYVAMSCRFWTGGDRHNVNLYGRYTDFKLFTNTKPHLQFTNEETQRGRDLLHQLGIPPAASWVCIHNRDAAYLDKAVSIRDWSLHDYRNFSIQSMMEAANVLANRGYYVLRIGSVVNEVLHSNNSKIIDYSSSHLRSDFGDIYLAAECAAYLGSDSGIACVPLTFRKPVCHVNFSLTLIDILLANTGSNYYPSIFKRLWHKKSQRFLSLREIFNADLVGAAESNLFVEAGVEPVSNTAEEIRDLTLEIVQRLEGSWCSQPDDEDLQLQFWNTCAQLFKVKLVGDIKGRVGTAFLRKNADLLN